MTTTVKKNIKEISKEKLRWFQNKKKNLYC